MKANVPSQTQNENESIRQWRYYNHSLLSNLSPDRTPDTTCLDKKDCWDKRQWGGKPFFALWTSDYGCEKFTEWWYCVKDDTFSLDKINKKHRYDIKRALEKCDSRIIEVRQYANELNDICTKNFSHYKKKRAKQRFYSNDYAGGPFVGVFQKGTEKLIGFGEVKISDHVVYKITDKADPDFLNDGVFLALNYFECTYFMGREGINKISNGERSINHETNYDEFLCSKFGFKKINAVLHLKYKKGYGGLVKFLYPFRCFLKKLDNLELIHLINAVLLLEEISRNHKER